MTCQSLEKRISLIGTRDMLTVYGDNVETLELSGLRLDGDADNAFDSGMTLFILGGESAFEAGAYVPTGLTPLFSSGNVEISSQGNYRYGDWYGKARSIIDIGKKLAVVTIFGAGNFNRDFISHVVLRPVIDRLLYESGYTILHAAAAVSGNSACIIAGDSGVGKSTLLAGLISSGMQCVSDDRVIVDSVPSSGLSLCSYPEYVRLSKTQKGPKYRHSTPVHAGGNAVPKAVFILEKGADDSAVSCQPISSVETAARLIHSFPPYMEDHMRGRSFGVIGDICENARGYLVKGWGDPDERLRSVWGIAPF